MHAIVMVIFTTNAHIKLKAINLAMIGVMIIQNGDVIKKAWIFWTLALQTL